MKKYLKLMANVAAIVAVILLMAFSQQKNNRRSCPEVRIDIDYGEREFTTDVLLVSHEIERILHNHFDSLQGKALGDINMEEVEKVLAAHAYVKDIEVYREINGRIHIQISQRRPILRVFGLTGHSFYIDEYGTVIPIKPGYPARVLVASGRIDDRAFKGNVIHLQAHENDSLPGIETLRNLYQMAQYIDQDAFLRKEITQINISGKEIHLVPLVGRHIIVMHDFTHFKRKLKKLKIFYKKGLSQGGWNRYKRINIEYRNQIVCTKI
jgi:cell division protein FtsQ